MDMSAVPAPLSAREAAARCGVDERTVRRWIARGRLAADKHGGVFNIAPCDLAPFLPPAAAPTDSIAADGPAAAAPATHGSSSADTEAPHLAAALADAHQRLMDLAHELTAKAEAAAMWQTRAAVLEAELARLRATPALGPGRDGPVMTEASSRPWWAFWRR